VSTLGERVKALRSSRKVLRDKFAEMLGVELGVVVCIESDLMDTPASLLLRMSEEFDADIHELVTGTPSPTIESEVRTLRELKHDFRIIRKDVETRLKLLNSIKRGLMDCDMQLNAALVEYRPKSKPGRDKTDTQGKDS